MQISDFLRGLFKSDSCDLLVPFDFALVCMHFCMYIFKCVYSTGTAVNPLNSFYVCLYVCMP